MVDTNKIVDILTAIHFNQKKNDPANKKQWYKIGKIILQGNKVKMHAQSKVGARRTYRYYNINKENWEGPSPRQFSKMRQTQFKWYLHKRQVNGVTCNSRGESLSELNPTTTRNHMINGQILTWDPSLAPVTNSLNT